MFASVALKGFSTQTQGEVHARPGRNHCAEIPLTSFRKPAAQVAWAGKPPAVIAVAAGLLVIVLVLAEGLIHAEDRIELLPELTNSLNTRG